MKKFLCLFLLLALTAGSASALEMRVIKLGLLAKMNSTESEYANIWRKTFAPHNEILNVITKFYDTLTAMQMALDKGEIDQMILPESIAGYFLNRNKNFESALALPAPGRGLAFGFLAENKKLRDEFNKALQTLRDDWTLSAIEGLYITNSTSDPEPVKFQHFDNAETIKIAVTGDMPPIDFIAADGTPAGFNTAVLSEIAALLKKNIELVNIDSGARSAALSSGRADVVFWYEIDTAGRDKTDTPDGVILSEPYYVWNKFIHIKKIPEKVNSSSWNYRRDFLNMYRRH
ncbi:MAG: transporter substrate-binding domain-containing protein [Synergistaceae bacterium]|nr:transporter substrate-binding domain-containing protein [Synergistaceae bacterium]